MATVATKPMTAEEFYEWANHPDNNDENYELEQGEAVAIPRPGRRHGLVCANVTHMLGTYTAKRKKGYVCSNNTGVIVERDPDTVRGPDVMLFEDAARIEDIDVKYGGKPPVLAVEVLSPNDTTGKIMLRIREQQRFGTRLVWVLDPEARNVIVYQIGKEYKVLEEAEELTGEDVLADLRVRVAELFALPGQ